MSAWGFYKKRYLCWQYTLTFSSPGLSSIHSRDPNFFYLEQSFFSSQREDAISWSQDIIIDEHIFSKVTTQNWHLHWIKCIQLTEEKLDLEKDFKKQRIQIVKILCRLAARMDSDIFSCVLFCILCLKIILKIYLQQFGIIKWLRAHTKRISQFPFLPMKSPLGVDECTSFLFCIYYSNGLIHLLRPRLADMSSSSSGDFGLIPCVADVVQRIIFWTSFNSS